MKTQSKTSTVERNTLESVFLAELTEIYHAQQRLGKIYQKMADAAHDQELKAALENQVHNTALQVSRMDKCFEILGLKADTVFADVVSGLIEAGEDAIENFQEGSVRDTGIIAVAQKIEHYGIAAYGTLRTLATLMGRVQCATLLEENKDEEAETDAALTKMSVNINKHALEGAK